MENIDIVQVWKSFDKKLDESLALNRKNTEEITRLKVHSIITSMKPTKIFALIAGLLWIIAGYLIVIPGFISGFETANKFFLFSAAIQVTLTAIAVAIYIYQLVLITLTTVDETVLVTQKRLAKLKASTLLVPRILLLQLPVWTTFYWSPSLFTDGNIFLIVIQVIVTLSFTFAAFWFFFNIKYENKNKKWFRFIFAGDKELHPAVKALEILSQIDEIQSQEK